MAKTVKKVVCLANSRKLSGRCIAGRELLDDGRPGNWIRPVSDRETEEVSEEERRYEDGSDPKVLDIIDIPLLQHRPRTCQSENWLLDPERYWRKCDAFAWQDLDQLTDPVGELWINGTSTRNGLNDQIEVTAADELGDSLRLLKLERLTVSVYAPGEAFGNTKRRAQAHFVHDDVEYRLWITDPTSERKYLNMSDGNYEIGPCYITVSLGEPFRGYYYKLVAAIIEQPQ